MGGRTHVFVLPLLRSKQFGSASLQSGSHAQAVVSGGRGLPWQCPSPVELCWKLHLAGTKLGLVESLSLLVSKSLPELVLHSSPENSVVLWCLLWVVQWKVSSAPGISIRSLLTWESVWQVKVACA